MNATVHFANAANVASTPTILERPTLPRGLAPGDTQNVEQQHEVFPKNKSKALALNFSLVVSVIIYAFLGAGVFITLEADTQHAALLTKLRTIRYCIGRMLADWRVADDDSVHSSAWPSDGEWGDPAAEWRPPDLSEEKLAMLEDSRHSLVWGAMLRRADAVLVPLSNPVKVWESPLVNCTVAHLALHEWNLLNSVAFSFTVMTTVGYGNLTPNTISGRVFCIVFAMFGIPLTMLILANLGKHMSLVATKIYSSMKRVHKCKHRRMRRSESAASRQTNATAVERSTDGCETAAGETNDNGGGSEHDSEQSEGAAEEESEEVSGPVILVVFLAYVLLGACTMPLIEKDMDFVNSIYTNVMSVTAVDFSAIVGGNEMFVPLKLVYACIGLAIATVAIEAGSNYLRKLHYFGRKVNVNTAMIWVGGQRISVNQLVRATCRQAGVDVSQVENLDLSRVVESAVAAEQGFMLPEEEEALLQQKKDPNRMRFIDSDIDSHMGDRDPPPPPAPASQPPSEMGDPNDSGLDRANGDATEGKDSDSGAYGANGCWALAGIQEESRSPSPLPETPPESSYGTPEPDIESEVSIVGVEWSPSPGQSVASWQSRLLAHQWRPSPPKPPTPRAIVSGLPSQSIPPNPGAQWVPSPPKPPTPRLVGSSWVPSPSERPQPRLVHSSWQPDSPDQPDCRIIGSQWRPTPPNPPTPRLIGWRWTPDSPDPPEPKAPSPPPAEPGPPSPNIRLATPPPPVSTEIDEAETVTLPPSDPEPSTPASPPPAPEPKVPEPVREAHGKEFGRRKVRADAKKRFALYQKEWEKVERLTRPRMSTTPTPRLVGGAAPAAGSQQRRSLAAGAPQSRKSSSALSPVSSESSGVSGVPRPHAGSLSAAVSARLPPSTRKRPGNYMHAPAAGGHSRRASGAPVYASSITPSSPSESLLSISSRND